MGSVKSSGNFNETWDPTAALGVDFGVFQITGVIYSIPGSKAEVWRRIPPQRSLSKIAGC